MNQVKAIVRPVLDKQDVQQAYCCMSDGPTPWPDALCLCRYWFAQHLGRHVAGYHLQLENGAVIGHLYYAFSEQALFPYQVETQVGVLYCEWVQPRYQKQGLGTQLFNAFLEEMQQAGAKGILVEATDLAEQMHFQHYLRRGFTQVDTSGPRRLLYLPLLQEQVAVQPLEMRIQPRQGLPVEVLLLYGYLCPPEAATMELVREVAREFGQQVVLREVELTPETLQAYGAARGVFINGRAKLGGGETEGAIRQAIREEL